MIPEKIDTSTLTDPSLKKKELIEKYKTLTELPVYCPTTKKKIDTVRPVSKYFGSPWLGVNEGENWPLIDGRKASFIMQLDIATLPEEYSKALGGTGLLQLFYDTSDDRDYGDYENSSYLRIVHPHDKWSTCGKEVSDNPLRDCWSPRRIISWKEYVDYPHGEHLNMLATDDLGDVEERFDAEISDLVPGSYQGDKLGGWPSWYQGVETPNDANGDLMTYVFQLDMGCFFDGPKFKSYAPDVFSMEGTGHIFVSKNNPTELKFVWAS